MQVLNNAPAFSVWKSYTNNVKNLRGSMSRLSSGMKIETAADDPAGLAISERLRAQARNSAAAAQNIENALSYAQTADSWMQKIQDIAGRMGELAVSANDETKTSTDRDTLQKEFTQMQDEIKRITTTTSGVNAAAGNYNGRTLFDGTAVNLQVGPNTDQTFTLTGINLKSDATDVVTGAVTWGAVITSDTSVPATVMINTQSTAAAAVGTVNAAVDFISAKRATLGAQSARMKHTLEGLRTYESNIRGAESQVRDVDMAKEATDFSKFQILSQVGTAMLAQANSLPQSVMRLIQ